MPKFYARSVNFHFLKNFHTARTNVSTPIMNSHKPTAIAPHLSRLDNNSTRRLPMRMPIFSSTSRLQIFLVSVNLISRKKTEINRPSTNQGSRTPSPFFLATQCQTTPDCLSHFLPTALLPPTLPSQPPPSHTVHSPTPTQPTTCTTVTTSPPKGRRKEK